MQQYQPKTSPLALTDSLSSSVVFLSSETKLVPDSFAEWLAQPASIIAPSEETIRLLANESGNPNTDPLL